jgi:hypothetical protein
VVAEPLLHKLIEAIANVLPETVKHLVDAASEIKGDEAGLTS